MRIPSFLYFLIITLVAISCQALLIKGWAIGPTRYEFNVENAFDEGVLNVHCKSDHDDLGLVRLPVHSNYTHRFKTELFKTTHYYCELRAPAQVRKVFDTFKDMIEFVDHQCGGRHCFWKVNEDGIYLFHIQKKQYFKKYEWEKYSLDEDSKGKN